MIFSLLAKPGPGTYFHLFWIVNQLSFRSLSYPVVGVEPLSGVTSRLRLLPGASI